jgi:hypothetical protein
MLTWYSSFLILSSLSTHALQFKKVQQAFEMLQSKLEEEEQNKLFTTVTFTVRIVKSPPPVGFGMVVVEDTTKGGIIAKVSVALPDSSDCCPSGSL